jgi:hypothetical protein
MLGNPWIIGDQPVFEPCEIGFPEEWTLISSKVVPLVSGTKELTVMK